LVPHGLRRSFADLLNGYNGQRIGAATVALGLAEGAYELGLAYTPTRIGSAGHGLAGSARMFSLSYVTSGRRPDIAKEINSWTISNDSL